MSQQLIDLQHKLSIAETRLNNRIDSAIRDPETPMSIKRRLWENDKRSDEYFPDLILLGNSADDSIVKEHIHLMQDYLNSEYYESGLTTLYWIYESAIEYHEIEWDLGIWNQIVLHLISKHKRNSVFYYGAD